MKKNWIAALLVSSSFALMATFAAAQMGSAHTAHQPKHPAAWMAAPAP